MTPDAWLEETYFAWLAADAFEDRDFRGRYEGVMRELHSIPFYWTVWLDENRAGDALAFRQSDFLGFQPDLDSIDQVWLGQWATATPSVLEVLLAMSRRWYYFYEGKSIGFFFMFMFHNMEFDRFPGLQLSQGTKDAIRLRVDNWLSRQFSPNGQGSPFPIRSTQDIRQLDIWGQMNAYSAEHFQ